MSLNIRPATVAALALTLIAGATLADEDKSAEEPRCSERNPEACDRDEIVEWVEWAVATSPEQVERRLSLDALPGKPLFGGRRLDEWFAYKARVEERYGLTWGTDYNAAWLRASESLGERTGFGGALRFFGVWEPGPADTRDAGALIWKIEHRHAYGSRVSPQALGSEVGYAGLLHLTLSDQRTRLSNLYWRQRWNDGNLVFVGGWTDTSDYVDVYTLASPWTSFFNYAFSTGSAAMPVPNEGLGLAVGGYIGDRIYAVAGFADANSDPHRPSEAFDTFFSEREYFKHVEFGFARSRENTWLNNTHLTLWQVDERTEAGVPDGWGANLSWSRLFADFWTVFARAGYAKDGGSILQKSLSVGGAISRVPAGNQLGIGVNWGEVNESTYGPGLDDQVTVEVYYRIHAWEELELTPDVQFIRNPALNPDTSSLWVIGLRARLAF
ncbi:MAG: carbohydrate porin [Woeseiaceae bacterium]|nr:carbohydrate porin [Woeseiaceae bacterium]